MMAVDSLLYLIIYWYVDKISPGDFGVGQPFYFPCMVSYWTGACVFSVRVRRFRLTYFKMTKDIEK